jgi:acetyltransferase
MSKRDLSALLHPRSVAVIGVDEAASRLGPAVLANLAGGTFKGQIAVVGHGVAPGPFEVHGSVERLPFVPDLAVICLPIELRSRHVHGTRTALVLAGTGHAESPALAAAEVSQTARKLGIRIIGPDCFGIQVPQLGLNASISASPLPPVGRIGLVVQSSTVCAAALDWARPQAIGFSTVIGLGHALDIDFGDALDFLGSDPDTRAILMVVEEIRERGEFIAAARAAARNKPVLALKIGTQAEAVGELGSHAGTLTRPEAVYDAVFRRAGMLRVEDVRELFMAAETLAHATPVRQGGLSIVANGHGIAMLAADELVRRGGHLATLSGEARTKLDPVVCGGAAANPVDLGTDAGADRYKTALDALLAAPGYDSLLVMHAPTVLADPDPAADAAIAAAKGRRASIIACWIGQERAAPARKRLREAGIPAYETPTDAVRAFMHLVDHRRNQDMLMETPPSVLDQFTPDSAAVRRLVTRALGELRFSLGEPEAKLILGAYGIPSVPTEVAFDAAEAGRIARRLDCPVALKILSPDIIHKSRYGGVVLDLPGAFEVEKAGYQMIERVRATVPGAKIEGFTVEPMARRPGAVEIMMGVATDPVFGPVILFGQGGTAVEAIGDVALGLPPLNMTLAKELMLRARVVRLLRGHGGHPPADLDALCLALVKISQLVVDVPEIVEMDINPLYADAAGVLALDARMMLAPAPVKGQRLAIRPYPLELEEVVTTRDGKRVLLRPIRPEDEPNHHVLISRMTREDLRFRFFTVVGEVPHSQMARLTQIDYVREMAFVAVPAEDPGRETLGVVRTVADADNDTAEYAVLVRSDLKGTGLGRLLMQKMIRYCRAAGVRRIVGEVLSENLPMLRLAEELGFKRMRFVEGDVIEVALELRPETPA